MADLKWKKLEVPARPRSLGEGRFLISAGDRVLASDVWGGTFELDRAKGWVELTKSLDTRIHGTLAAWDGAVHAFGSNGAVYRLEGVGWAQTCAADATYSGLFPLLAFDPVKKLVVAWGPQANSTRKDTTLVHDGTKWSKGGKNKQPFADAGKQNVGFCMWFDPGAQCIALASSTQARTFDGKSWALKELTGSGLAHWERLASVDEKGDAIVVQRWVNDTNVARLTRTATGYEASVLTKFQSPLARAGMNVAFDLGVYAPKTNAVIAVDAELGETYIGELS